MFTPCSQESKENVIFRLALAVQLLHFLHQRAHVYNIKDKIAAGGLKSGAECDTIKRYGHLPIQNKKKNGRYFSYG